MSNLFNRISQKGRKAIFEERFANVFTEHLYRTFYRMFIRHESSDSKLNLRTQRDK